MFQPGKMLYKYDVDILKIAIGELEVDNTCIKGIFSYRIWNKIDISKYKYLSNVDRHKPKYILAVKIKDFSGSILDKKSSKIKKQNELTFNIKPKFIEEIHILEPLEHSSINNIYIDSDEPISLVFGELLNLAYAYTHRMELQTQEQENSFWNKIENNLSDEKIRKLKQTDRDKFYLYEYQWSRTNNIKNIFHMFNRIIRDTLIDRPCNNRQFINALSSIGFFPMNVLNYNSIDDDDIYKPKPFDYIATDLSSILFNTVNIACDKFNTNNKTAILKNCKREDCQNIFFPQSKSNTDYCLYPNTGISNCPSCQYINHERNALEKNDKNYNKYKALEIKLRKRFSKRKNKPTLSDFNTKFNDYKESISGYDNRVPYLFKWLKQVDKDNTILLK